MTWRGETIDRRGFLKAAGVAGKDVQTSGVSLNPDYQYVAGRPPRIKGYYTSNTVNVTVREIGASVRRGSACPTR